MNTTVLALGLVAAAVWLGVGFVMWLYPPLAWWLVGVFSGWGFIVVLALFARWRGP